MQLQIYIIFEKLWHKMTEDIMTEDIMTEDIMTEDIMTEDIMTEGHA